jgi:transcriptional regulator with XRE-family HTH domain
MSRKDSISEAFRTVLLQERQRMGVTQMSLARRLGWHQSAISKIESGGRIISLDQLASIARALDVNPIELFARAVKYAKRE